MQKFRKKIAETLGVPPSAVMNIPVVTLQGNISAAIENYKSVLLYTDSEIRINCGATVVSLYGAGLCIDNIGGDFVSVSGDFQKIEYETVKKR